VQRVVLKVLREDGEGLHLRIAYAARNQGPQTALRAVDGSRCWQDPKKFWSKYCGGCDDCKKDGDKKKDKTCPATKVKNRMSCEKKAQGKYIKKFGYGSKPDECAPAAAKMGCKTFMFSTEYPVWGCRCCDDPKKATSHGLWDLYESCLNTTSPASPKPAPPPSPKPSPPPPPSPKPSPPPSPEVGSGPEPTPAPASGSGESGSGSGARE
jgi:hypothetical protein